MEIGEYIRTPKGLIGKVLEKSFFGNTRYLIKWDIAKAYYITKIKNIKHSKNIVDLIEVGDYVNGHKVVKIKHPVLQDKLEVESEAFKGEYFIDIKDIKSIVPKEQFANMEYKINE